MDAFAGVTIGSRQYNFRASRRLRPDPLTTKVGPLEFSVIEGFRRHRLSLAENESGISFDIEFPAPSIRTRKRSAWLAQRPHQRESGAAQQLGRYSGWLKVDGQRYELNPQQWCGQRDHSWGIRGELRTDETSPPLTHVQPSFLTWVAVQFLKRGLLWSFTERAPGDIAYLTGEETLPLGQRASRGLHIDDVSHEIVWARDELGQTLEHAVFDLTMANGSKRHLELRTLPARYASSRAVSTAVCAAGSTATIAANCMSSTNAGTCATPKPAASRAPSATTWLKCAWATRSATESWSTPWPRVIRNTKKCSSFPRTEISPCHPERSEGSGCAPRPDPSLRSG